MKNILYSLSSAATLGVALCPAAVSAADKSASDRPNIIFILCDDMGISIRLSWTGWLPRACASRKLMQVVPSVLPRAPR